MGGENRRIHTEAEIQKQVCVYIYIFYYYYLSSLDRERLWERVPMQICCVILMSCDVLCVCDDGGSVHTHMHVCLSEIVFG